MFWKGSDMLRENPRLGVSAGARNRNWERCSLQRYFAFLYIVGFDTSVIDDFIAAGFTFLALPAGTRQRLLHGSKVVEIQFHYAIVLGWLIGEGRRQCKTDEILAQP